MSPEQSTQPALISVMNEQMPQSVDVRQRALGLINTLNLLNSAATLEGRINHTYATKVVLSATPEQSQASREFRSSGMKERNRLLKASRTKFHEVYERSNGPTPLNDPEFVQAFGSFYATYYGPKKSGELRKQRKSLKLLADALDPQYLLFGDDRQETDNSVVINNPEASEVSAKEARLTDEELSTRQKLEGLRDDPHAGFLPATHREKNYAVALLDYLKNPKTIAGTANQLQEIFIHQAKPKKEGETYEPRKGRRALVSVTYEIGDYLVQATRQKIALEKLAKLVVDCPNPSALLLDEVGKSHEAYGPLVRYMDLLAFRDQGSLVTEFDPLGTTEDRSPYQDFQGKNKTVEDKYTAQTADAVVIARINSEIAKLTIGDLRSVAGDAVSNEAKRAEFWTERLKEVMKHGAARHIARSVVAKADRIQRHAQVS